MMDLNLNISIIMLNVKSLNTPIKDRKFQEDWWWEVEGRRGKPKYIYNHTHKKH